MKTITIQIDTTDEAMVGGFGWENCDPRASVLEFKAQVLKRVGERFPGYAIEIEETDHANTVVFADGRDYSREVEEDQQAVREIISSVWADAEWYVEA
ncbi:MAG TPA: hypothetical protein PKV97_13535 [Thauera aminoaromatica]|nr:hypothetical protein [Thauera aminoaromatica]